MSSSGEIEEDGNDAFWGIQMTCGGDAGSRPFGFPEGPDEYEDNVLPAGTELTPQSLAGMFGCVREVAIPMMLKHDTCEGRHTTDTAGDSGDGEIEDPTVRLGDLVLKLREVNGRGVMSGVGGDVWCAALLLSSWLLANPEVVQDLDVLELGSGLGLCGIAVGYLARTVILTDYIDELLVNLDYNIEANRTSRVAVFDATKYRNTESSEKVPTGTGSAPQVDDLTKTVCGTMGAEGLVENVGSDLRKLSARSQLCDIHVQKLDWTSYVSWGRSRRGLAPNGEHGGSYDGASWNDDEDYWEDAGPGTTLEGCTSASGNDTEENGDSTEAEKPVPACDVAIGSALIYSPHHACVADVLLRAFSEGGCRAAYVVQLSTRPGFDEFLRRLRLCGLDYRLKRMSAVVPALLLEELRRRLSSIAVVGGQVATETSTTNNLNLGRRIAEERGLELEGVAALDEFVLCSIFRHNSTKAQR